MAINYYLQENHLSNDKDAHAAHIMNYGSLDSDAIVRQMAARGTTFSDAELFAFMVLLTKTVCEELAKGYSVRLPFAKINLSIGGHFDNMTDNYDRNRHEVRASLTPGPALKKMISEVRLHKVIKPVAAPSPKEYFDIKSGIRNSIITPNGIATIVGSELRIDPHHPQQGIFFVSEDKLQEFKVEEIASATNLRLSFQVPELPPSTAWHVEIRKGYGRARSIIRSGILSYMLHTG